jgi:hypothetical protein
VPAQHRPAGHGGVDERRVEDLTTDHPVRTRAGALRGTARRGAEPQPGHSGSTLGETAHSQCVEEVEHVSRDPVTAGLVTRERRGVQHQHTSAGAQLQQPQRGRRPGRARPDDRDVVDHVLSCVVHVRPLSVQIPMLHPPASPGASKRGMCGVGGAD